MTSINATRSALDVNNEASSWADLVRKVDQERKQLPWDPATTQPVQRGSLYHRKRAEREFDPVAMEYRDPFRETSYKEEKRKQLENKKYSVEEFRRSTYNILSHQGPPRKYDQLVAMRNEQLYKDHKHEPRPYHMLTNLPHNVHQKAPLNYDEGQTLKELTESYKNSRLAQHAERLKTKGKDREFSIISNEFYENPDERKVQEYQKLKKHVLKKYWETHDYDPIKGVYYSPEKEELYQQQKTILSEVYGKSKELSIPPSIQYAESTSYNIINHDIKDEFKLSIAMTSDQRSINRKNKLPRELKMIEENEIRKSHDEQRHMNRISFKRWETEIDRGYNPIKNEVVTNPYTPLPARPATMWERMTANPDQSINNNTGSRYINQFPSRVQTALNETNESFNSGRARNLAGTVPTSRAHTAAPATGKGFVSARNDNLTERSKPAVEQSASVRVSSSVPKLDLTRADFGESISYQEPTQGPPGLSIPMVRTGGGLSKFH